MGDGDETKLHRILTLVSFDERRKQNEKSMLHIERTHRTSIALLSNYEQIQ